MESISELRKICEKKHTKGVTQPNLYAKFFIRKLSIYLTWLLLHTSITANQVTLLQLFSTVMGVILIIPIKIYINLVGVFLLQLGYIFDNVDGEIARYRKKSTVSGVYIDLFNHLIMIPLMYIGLGFRYYFASGGNFIFVVIAVLGGFSMLNPTKRAIWAMIYYFTEKWQTPSYNYKNLHSGLLDVRESNGEISKNNEKKTFYNFYNLIKRLIFGYPNCVNLYSIMILLEWVLKTKVYVFLYCIFISIGIFQILRESISFTNTVRTRKPEKQFQRLINSLKKQRLL